VAGNCSYYSGEAPKRLTLRTNSEQMGPIVNIWWLQLGGTCLLRPLLCFMANYDGKAAQVRYPVRAIVSLVLALLCASMLARIMHCRFETTHPLGKIARCRYPSDLMHTPLGRIPFSRHHDITTEFTRHRFLTDVSCYESSSFPCSIIDADCPCDTRWSLGSALFLASWAAMMGPWNYVSHLMSTPRLPFTAAYFGSIALTLYFSLGVSFPPEAPLGTCINSY
jgi:Got1/Sft2-like family